MLGHQRRRLLQRQLRASVREPDRADQPDPDAADLLDRRGADQHVRPHGQRPAAGLGDLRGDGRAVLRRRRRLLLGGSRAAIPRFAALHVDQTASPLQAGGNMEGKEVRFGIANSALFTTVTTDASCGAVNNMHDSLTAARRPGADGQHDAGRGHLRRRRLRPLRHAAVRHRRGVRRRADGRPHAGISRQEARGQGGEDGHAGHPDPAAVDAGLYRARRGAARPAPARWPMPGRMASREVLYAYVSATANNGSAFAGLSANTPFWNTTLGLGMFIGRFLMIIPVLAIAGSLAAKKIVPASAGTFPTARHAVRRAGDRRDPDHRRTDLLPGPRARPAWSSISRCTPARFTAQAATWTLSNLNRAAPGRRCSTPPSSWPGDRQSLPQARSAADGRATR